MAPLYVPARMHTRIWLYCVSQLRIWLYTCFQTVCHTRDQRLNGLISKMPCAPYDRATLDARLLSAIADQLVPINITFSALCSMYWVCYFVFAWFSFTSLLTYNVSVCHLSREFHYPSLIHFFTPCLKLAYSTNSFHRGLTAFTDSGTVNLWCWLAAF